MIFKLITMFISFFKEIIFDNKEETNFKNPQFNFRKLVVLLMIIFSLGMNLFLMDRVYYTAKRYVELKIDYNELLDDFQDNLTLCGKNIHTDPSDEGLTK